MITLNNVSKIFCSGFDRARAYGFRDMLRGKRGTVPRRLEFFALKDVSLRVGHGESFVVFGVQGSGKTTLARLVCGMFQPDRGQVTVSGRVQSPPNGKLGLNPFMTLAEYVDLVAAILGVPVANQKDYRHALLKDCNVEGYADARMADFPRASLRPLLMSASLLADGDVFVFDNAYVAGSGEFRVRCLARVAEIVKTRTVLILTEIPKLPPFPVDHAMILHEGRALYYGAPDRILPIFQSLADDLKQERDRALKESTVATFAIDSARGDGADTIPPRTSQPPSAASQSDLTPSTDTVVALMEHLADTTPTAGAAMSPLLPAIEVRRISASNKPLLLGPWLGTAHWELMYWRPYVAWMLKQLNLADRRVIAVSRAGADLWYTGLADTYVDLLDLYSREEFEGIDAERIRRTGKRKQRSLSDMERDVLDNTARHLGLDEFDVLHPATMFRMCDKVWRGCLPPEFVSQYSHYTRIETEHPVELDLPAHYVAVRFTSDPASGDRPETQGYVNELVQALAANGPVVALYTGYSIEGPPEELTLDACDGLISLRDRVGPRESARLETRVLAGADLCVCTMSSAVPLALCCGVETTGLYLGQHGFNVHWWHWAVADVIASQLESGLAAVDLRQVPALQLADRVRRRGTPLRSRRATARRQEMNRGGRGAGIR